ncbi:MAG: aconitase X [Candidatus Velthaea sp.]
MQLTKEEDAIRAGRLGEVARKALEMQIEVGTFFNAERFVAVKNVHMMGTMEAMGEAGYRYFQDLVREDGRFAVSLTTNARCVDPAAAPVLRQDPAFVVREGELMDLQAQLGAMTVHTCINYQTVYQPHLGEHVAWGDTGTVVYANSILGARTNYESGPAALAAGITGRTPAYGFHLDDQRRATVHLRVSAPLHDVADWGALGAAIGRRVMDYWTVPVIEFTYPVAPEADDLKHLCASIASHGSNAMFHIVGVTPEAPTVEAALGGRPARETFEIGAADIAAVYASYPAAHDEVELVVFTAPQLSLFELRRIGALLAGRRFHESTRVIITTNEMNKDAAGRLGDLAPLEAAGALVLQGTCWYIMEPERMRDIFGWSQVVTNSAKLVNIIAGARYAPVLMRTQDCIEAAVSGRIAGVQR